MSVHGCFSLSIVGLVEGNLSIAMTVPPILPKREALRRAVAWLPHQGPWTPELIEQASQRFDLSPIEEKVLREESRRSAKRWTRQQNR
jgi:hypothetical protein